MCVYLGNHMPMAEHYVEAPHPENIPDQTMLSHGPR